MTRQYSIIENIKREASAMSYKRELELQPPCWQYSEVNAMITAYYQRHPEMEDVMRCDECGREIRNGEGHRIGCNFDRTPKLDINAIEAERRTRIAKYVAVANRINPTDGSKRESRFEFEFSKTGISQRGENVEDFARRHVSDLTGGYAELVRVEKVEAA